MTRRLPSLLLALGVLWAGAAPGLPGDRERPIELEADRAQLDQTTGVSVYEGNVVITQGSMRLTADTVTIRLDDGEFRHLRAVGSPATFRYKPAAGKPDIDGVGRQLDYDVGGSSVVVSDGARITQGGDVFTGERIEYDLSSDMVRARSPGGGRVRITIQPRTGGGG